MAHAALLMAAKPALLATVALALAGAVLVLSIAVPVVKSRMASAVPRHPRPLPLLPFLGPSLLMVHVALPTVARFALLVTAVPVSATVVPLRSTVALAAWLRMVCAVVFPLHLKLRHLPRPALLPRLSLALSPLMVHVVL